MVSPAPAPSARSAGPVSARADFGAAADAFVDLVRTVPDDAWAAPGLGVWTVRELVGHTTRALTTVEEYLAAPPAEPVDPADAVDPVEYFRIGTRLGLTNSESVADRGRAAGAALGESPAAEVAATLARVRQVVDATDDDVVLTSRLASMRLVDYLPTRTFELVVHGTDLACALGRTPQVPPGPLASALGLATGLALDAGLGPDLLLALTGRRPLPAGTCVL